MNDIKDVLFVILLSVVLWFIDRRKNEKDDN